MRIQTWSLTLQVSSIGELDFTLWHAYYAPNGRQLPRQVAAGQIDGPADLHRQMDTLADMIIHGEVYLDGSVQTPLF